MSYNEKFYNLEWHDAMIERIVIDQRRFDANSIFDLYIVWPDPDNTYSLVRFKDVLTIDISMDMFAFRNIPILKAEIINTNIDTISDIIVTDYTTVRIEIATNCNITITSKDLECIDL